tara:strand:- start:254 stop:481 length:228 start_codon:yes stop_codon:yes gene_type:complete
MMGRKQKLKGGNEFDVVSSWRKLFCYLQHAGVTKSIKKKMNKRARQEGKRRMYTREDTNLKGDKNDRITFRRTHD